MQDQTTDDDQLLVLSRQFVELKVPFADDDYKEQLAVDVKEKIEETIRMELVAAMTPDQVDAYSDMLDDDNVTEETIADFIKQCGISPDEVTQSALTKFRLAYLGV